MSTSENTALCRAFDLYDSIEDEYQRTLESTGVVFALRDTQRSESRQLISRLVEKGARVRNGGASVVLGRMSRACAACTGSCVSRSFAITNNCHRDCFFCFNPNQEEFAYYCEHLFPWREQLDNLAREEADPACIGLTGGEPLLEADETCAFFAYARKLFPDAHLRLYTSGDLLDDALLGRMRMAGLDEMRFSIKQDDPERLREKVFANMALAKEVIPSVMVEMPVVPGTESFMRKLMVRLDSMGVDGINLLEFTYAMWNWPVYESLGLTLRNPPFRVFFDYSYAGSLAVQDSEELCLRLMLWAHEQGLSLGMHYCSLENKHRAQVRTINEAHADINACYAFDCGDYFLKTALVFGEDRAPVRDALRLLGCTEFLEDEKNNATSFHPHWLDAACAIRRKDGGLVQVCVSSNVAVAHDGGVDVRELKLELAHAIDAAPVQLEDRNACIDQMPESLIGA